MKTLGWGKKPKNKETKSHFHDKQICYVCKVANNSDDSKAVAGARKVLKFIVISSNFVDVFLS